MIETAETRSYDDMDQDAVVVDNQEESSAEDPGESIWRQSDVDISDTSTGIQNVLENEDEFSGEIHEKFSVNLMDLSTKFEKSSLSSTKWISNPPNICTVNIAIPNAGLANLAQQ